MAVEDIGLADPQAQGLCLEAWNTYERLGAPRGSSRCAGVVYMALAPKSNAVYVAYKAAREARGGPGRSPPQHILNAPTRLMKEQGFGAGYQYDHDAEDAFSGRSTSRRA
jgi:putative ATPase